MIDKLSWIAVYPEIVLLVMACVIAMADLGDQIRGARQPTSLTMLTLARSPAAGLYALGGQTIYAFGNMVVSDAMGNWLKCFATIAMMVTLVYGRPYARCATCCAAASCSRWPVLPAGHVVMISGNNFLVIYLGLELLTLSSYALVALRRDNATATEAAMKYFVLGAHGLWVSCCMACP
jgi:NADH-quinone oxidoreductase subunit N